MSLVFQVLFIAFKTQCFCVAKSLQLEYKNNAFTMQQHSFWFTSISLWVPTSKKVVSICIKTTFQIHFLSTLKRNQSMFISSLFSYHLQYRCLQEGRPKLVFGALLERYRCALKLCFRFRASLYLWLSIRLRRGMYCGM